MQLIYVYKYEHYEKWSNIVKSSCFDNEALAPILSAARHRDDRFRFGTTRYTKVERFSAAERYQICA